MNNKQSIIHHTHHSTLEQTQYPTKDSTMNQSNRTTQSFPYRLRCLIENESSDDDGVAPVAWLPHGLAFVIVDQDRLAKTLPTFFNQSKVRSFTRQLNLWGFKR
jgi:hypothetical protein